MEQEMLNDLIDDLIDTRTKNTFLKCSLMRCIEDNDLVHTKEYYNMLVKGEDLALEIEKIINDYACKN